MVNSSDLSSRVIIEHDSTSYSLYLILFFLRTWAFNWYQSVCRWMTLNDRDAHLTLCIAFPQLAAYVYNVIRYGSGIIICAH